MAFVNPFYSGTCGGGRVWGGGAWGLSLGWLFWAVGSGCAASPEQQIRAVLDAQVAAWNRGDIEGFMEGYWRSDDLTFVSVTPSTQPGGTGQEQVTRGWQATLDRYRRRYATREQMGRLAFEDLSVRVVSADRAEVLGRYVLQRVSDRPSGRFALDVRKIDSRWRIVGDRTVADADQRGSRPESADP